MRGHTHIGGRGRARLAVVGAVTAVGLLSGCLYSGPSLVFSFSDGNGQHCVIGEALVSEQADLIGAGVFGVANTTAKKGANCTADENIYTWAYLDVRADVQKQASDGSGPFLCVTDFNAQNSSRDVQAVAERDSCGAGYYRTVGSYGYKYGSSTINRTYGVTPWAPISNPYAGRSGGSTALDPQTAEEYAAAWAANEPQAVGGADGERVGTLLPFDVDDQTDRIVADLAGEGYDPADLDPAVRRAVWTLDPVDVVAADGTAVGVYGFHFIALDDLAAEQAQAQAVVDAAGL